LCIRAGDQKMKKSIATVFAAIMMMMSTAAMADIATITKVNPVQGEQIQQQQVCSPTGFVGQVEQDRSTAGSILGGITGAVVGSHAGNGNGRLAATAVGAIIGAVAGDRIDNRQPNIASVQQQSCRLVSTIVPRTVGYLVTYEFGGRKYQSMLPYDPSEGGNTELRVTVSVSVNPR
jgi:uncharacterized protein YcfJ